MPAVFSRVLHADQGSMLMSTWNQQHLHDHVRQGLPHSFSDTPDAVTHQNHGLAAQPDFVHIFHIIALANERHRQHLSSQSLTHIMAFKPAFPHDVPIP